MHWLARLRPSPAMVVALIALFVSIGGVGYAAATIGSGQIKNNSIKSTDIKNKGIGLKDISSKARKSLKGNKGAKGEAGAPGAAGSARAYGVVTKDATVIAGQSKGITATRNPGNPGSYCVKAPGISSANTPIVATPDNTEGNGVDHTAVFASSTGEPCNQQGGWVILMRNNGVLTDIRFSVVIP